MTAQTSMQKEILQKIVDFQKDMDELRLLHKATQDLRKFKEMIKIRQFD
jgi:hypothetical protein